MIDLLSRLKIGDKRSVIVKKNIIASFAIRGASILVSLMLVPMTLGYVSSELYGIWLTLSSVMIWLNFFDIGFTLGLKNKLTEAIAVGNWHRGRVLVSTTYFIMILIFIPLCLLLEFCVPYVNWTSFFNVNPVYNEEIVKAMSVLIVFFCLQMIVNVLTAIIAAFQQVALSSLFPVIGNFLSLIVIWLLANFCPPSLFFLAFAISSTPVIVIFIASLILFNGKFKIISPSVFFIRKEYVHDLFSLGFKFFLIQIQVVIMFQATNVLISKVSGPDDVTAYNIAYKFLSVAMMLYTIILTPLWPAFTDAYAKKDFSWMNRIYKRMVHIYYASGILMFMMIVLSPVAYRVWIGDKSEIPFIMTLSVGIYILLTTWDSLQVQLINGVGAIKLQAYVTTIGIVLHIPLSLFLGSYIGAIGVIFSMSLITVIYILFFTTQIRRILKQTATGIWIA